MIDWIVDKYLTWKTGKNKSQRDFEQWRATAFVFYSDTVEGYFYKFKYVIEIDPEKVYNDKFNESSFNELPFNGAFEEYMYPRRSLGQNVVVYWFRCTTSYHWDGKIHIDECFGEDRLFAATNSEEDAVQIALKFS